LRVAALYDVHAMPVPLAAVLDEVAAEGVDRVVFGGDLIYGPCPREAVELARAVESASFVRGNADRSPHEWEREHVAAETLEWLAALPATVSCDGVLYCHAAPGDDKLLVSADTPAEAIEDAYANVSEPVIVIGHTHHQFDRRVAGRRLVNAGSIGMPYEDEVAAFWALLVDGEPSFRRTAFDVDRAVAEVRASGWPRADEFVRENLLEAPSRAEAIAQFEQRRTS
jgi:diadenosine tetraphosphatase ApaH/serine/threonine PP2A family protein phosphatase